MSKQSDLKTIHEFLADNPNVDVSRQWERCWNLHGRIADPIIKRFDARLHPISQGADYYTSPDQQMEGAFFGYTGKDMDWFVRSWLGNRKASIIDMNVNVCLGQCEAYLERFVARFMLDRRGGLVQMAADRGKWQ